MAADEREALILEIQQRAPSFGRLDRTSLADLREVKRQLDQQAAEFAAAGFVDESAPAAG